ncbi:MAG: hypothetical protein IPP74_13975 [Alphaproteobacteria bacterium]|nr:hypothetical protein [Alphaproteobacteria bacterium]
MMNNDCAKIREVRPVCRQGRLLIAIENTSPVHFFGFAINTALGKLSKTIFHASFKLPASGKDITIFNHLSADQKKLINL